MIKPIDTQVLYPQTPEIAGRQHRSNQIPLEQQTQFGNIMKKEVQLKKDTIIAPHETENLKTNKDGAKQSNDQNLKKKKREKKKTSQFKEHSKNTIDIRI